jgi:sugar phosphate isomerase/epimerase
MMVERDIAGLEIAPGMLFADAEDAFDPPAPLIRQRLAEIADAGLTLVSMQSLLFGVKDVALFGDADRCRAYVAALGRAIRLAGTLGIPHLVLGSPRERAIPEGMPKTEAGRIAAGVLAEIADLAWSHGCRIGLEPNPAIYGTNFATHIGDAARIVREVARPGLCLTLDIGNLQINAEMPELQQIVARNADLIGHVHLSEPELALAPGDTEMACQVISALKEAGYPGWLSIEMRASGEESRAALALALARLNTARSLADRCERPDLASR